MIEKQYLKEVKLRYAGMRDVSDLVDFLNFVKPKVFGEDALPFSVKQINYHSNSKFNSKRYREFNVSKKNGGVRKIHAPCNGLNAILKCLNYIFQIIYTPHNSAYGFVCCKSIVDNAKHHTESLYVYNIDLKDFFHSIDKARVWGRLKVPPFNLNDKHQRSKLANVIAGLVSHEFEVDRLNSSGNPIKELREVLPQGAATSPIISNMICEKLDRRLSGLAKRFGLRYSRYADDITFSSMHNVYHKKGEFLKELQEIIAGQGFMINTSKTRLQKQGYRQVVTGLVVNKRVNVPKRYIKNLRAWLYKWEQYGLEKTYSWFLEAYNADKGHVKKKKPSMECVIAGKLEYLKMVRGSKDDCYLNLSRRFLALQSQENSIAEVIKKWEDEGIEAAMNFYYSKVSSNNVTVEP
jgi:RNA-directed DNA polymerase